MATHEAGRFQSNGMEAGMQLNMNEFLPLRDVVFNALRESILHGEMKPGERLIEVTLSQQLGVSRTPVREAIRKLEQEGLVKILPRRGAVVANISEKNVHDVLEVRRALERLAANLAVERITPQEKIRLRSAEREFASCIGSKNLAQIAGKDEAFHDIIYEAAKNQKLQFLINNLREQMYRYRLEYLKDEATRRTLVQEHTRIADAIIRGEAELAMSEASVHIDNQESAILRKLAGM